MSAESAYYCVIQYCPDRGREETANVGVLLCLPGSRRVQAKVGVLTPRARQFFGLRGEQAAAPNSAAAALAHAVNYGAASIDSLEALQAFVATRANDIQLTEPRLIRVTNFAHDLEQLYGELVETAQTESAALAREPNSTIPAKLDAVFTRLSLAGRVTMPGKVRVPVLGRELEIPYAYRNGILNLVKPQVFVAGKVGNRALQLAGEAQLLAKYPDVGQRRLIVVAGSGSTPDAEMHAAQLIGSLGVKFVPQDQADAFAAEVEQQAY